MIPYHASQMYTEYEYVALQYMFSTTEATLEPLLPPFSSVLKLH